jgi:uncharacterized protein YjbI with pentapeptide repeats
MIDILSVSEHEHQEFNNLDLKQSSLSQVEFNKCSFTRCNFSQSSLIECRFYDCTFRACDLSLVKLNGHIPLDGEINCTYGQSYCCCHANRGFAEIPDKIFTHTVNREERLKFTATMVKNNP